MKISFNPSNSNKNILDLIKNNKDIIFDLKGHSIFARGVEFKGTDTNTWRDIKINNVSIGSHTLDLRNGSNTTLTNTNGVVTINSTWRPVVDNLTSDSTTSSLSAKQGKVLKALIDGKSNSDHNHDDRYVRYYAVTTLDCNNLAAGLTAARISATNAAHTNHSAYLYISDVGTPFQIQIPDSSIPYIYKRYYGSGKWSGWFKLNAGYADSAGSVAWANVTGKPSSYTPSAHTHAWNSLTHSSTTENQAILTNGKANGWKLLTLNIARWDNAANNAHSHANKSVLDGITSALVNSWNTAYNFVSNITGTDADKVINKWEEIVNFLAGITEDNKLNTLLNSKLSILLLSAKDILTTKTNNALFWVDTKGNASTITTGPFTDHPYALLSVTNYNLNAENYKFFYRSRLAFSSAGDIKVASCHHENEYQLDETWYNVLTSKNSGINGSTIKLNGTSITVYSSGTADGRYVKKSGDTMSGVLTIDTTNFGALTIKRNDDANGASIQFRGKSSIYGYIGLNNSTKDKLFLRWSSDTSRIYTILDTSSTYISNGKGVINGTTITQVDNATNSTNSTNARKLVNWYSTRPTSLNAQFGDGSLRIFYATSSTTEGKPAEDSHILHLAWDNTGGFDAQLAVHARSGKVSTRAQNGGTWQPWKTLAFTTDIPTSLKNPYSFNVFGVVYDGSAAKTVTTSNFISLVSEATATITDGTMLITSYASNSGFADTNAVNVPYKRKAIHLWEYIKAKTDSLYATKGHNHDGRYLRLSGLDTMQGNLYLHSHGTSYIGKGLGDKSGADFTEANIVIRSWWGISFKSYDDIVRTYIDTRTGNIGTKGVLNAVGAVILGRVYNGGDDEGIIINPASNGYAGLILGTHNGVRSVFYLNKGNPFWRYNNGSTNLDIYHPKKSGTIALTSDIPDKNSWNYDDRYLRLTGGWMSGDINFGGDNRIYWGRNTDSASISFKNDGDRDANSYMSFVTSDNGNEYFRWSHSSGSTNTEWMALRSDGLRVRGTKVSLEGHTHDDRYYTKAESNAKYITDIATSVNKLTFTRNGSNIIRDITVNVVHSLGHLTNIPNKDATTKASPGLLIYDSYGLTIGTNSYSSVLSINTGGTIQIAGDWGDDRARNLYWRSLSDRNVADYPWKSWRTILDSENYSSTLDSRYYTESEVNSLLSRKLDRVNLTTGSWNPRGWNLAADYHYNGGDLSISESGGKIHVSVDGYFWLNEGLYRVLDTSDIGDIRDSVTLHQYLSATDAAWYPLVWGGNAHKNTSDSTGAVYKSYDKLSWLTSSLTLYATNIQTNNIKNLSIGGGIYWNPYVEATTDNTDAASITLVRLGVAGGTTLVLSLMNDTNDTILFKTNTAARLYHNSYPILTTLNTYVSNNKGYINGTEITLVNNADMVDGAHLSDIKNWSDRTASAYWKAGWYKVASAQTATNTEAFLTLDVNAAQSKGHATLFIRKRADSKPYFICTHNNNLNLADFRLYYNGMSMVLYARVPNDWNGRVFRIISEGREGTYDHIWTLYSNVSSTDPNAISAEGGNPYINPTYSGRVDWSNSSDKANYANSAGSVAWNNVTGKPSEFNPAAHTHTVFKNNLMIKGTNGISDSASIHLGIGDSDTGFKWISDGVCLIYANNVAVGLWTSGGMNWFKNPTVNGNKVWNAGNDGSGSGLDADTLDGEHASSFVRAGHYESNDLNKLDTYSFIRSVNSNVSSTSPKGNTGWYNVILLVHRNGASDGPSYIGLIALGMTTNTNDMFFRGKRTDPWKTVIHSGNIGNQTVANAYHLRINSANTWSTWYWAGLSGLPSWLWGSNDGTNMYVWDPSNFRVAYASSAGNADTVDGYHATDGRTFNGDIHWGSWNDAWSDGTHTHPWYGFDHRYPNTGVNSTTISDYFGMTIKTHNTLLLDCETLLLNSRGNVGIGTTSPTQKLDVHGNIRATGQIIREGSGLMWVTGRNGALLRETSAVGYHTLWSLKTTNGSWDFGEYNAGSDWNNIPVLSYITDSNYNSGNNATTYQIKFPLASGTVALTSNIPNPTNYYWANVKISASSSTTTSPTVLNLTATNSIRMGNILLEHTDEINNSANGSIHLNYRNSGNVSLCYGGGNVGIGTTTPSYKLDVNGLMRASGFHHASVNSDNYMLLAGGGYKSFGGDDSTPIFLGCFDLYRGDDGTISSSFYCLGYSVPFTYTRGGNYCKIVIPDTTRLSFYIIAATASVNYSGGGMDTWTGYHRGSGAWWLHCYAFGWNEVRVKGFCQADKNNDSWWGGNPLWNNEYGANRITVCIFGHVKYK